MKLFVPTTDGYLADKYAKFSPEDYRKEDTPIRSFPITIEGLPEETKALALDFIDYDSIPVCGFAWIHWVMANIPAEMTDIPENFSQTAETGVQGMSSSGSKFVGKTSPDVIYRYNGPQPPDQDHDYTLTVYALSDTLPLANGFYLNEMYKAMDGKVLAKASIVLKGRS